MSGTVVQYYDEQTKKSVTVTPETPLPVSITPGANSVGTNELKDGSVTTTKLSDGAVTVEKLDPQLKVPQAEKVPWDGVQDKPGDYPPSEHTHQIAQVVGLQDALDGKLSEVADKSVTIAKLAQEVLSRIDYGKFSQLSGNGNDANKLTDAGIYFNSGGYGLKNAPRDRYGWMLIVSHGASNGKAQGGQLYLDVDGFDFRGFTGSTFTAWESFIIKNKVEDIQPIADPASTTSEDLANAYNALLTALKG